MFINMVTADKFSKPKLKEILKYSLLSKETHGKESKMGGFGRSVSTGTPVHPPSPHPLSLGKHRFGLFNLRKAQRI